MYHWNSILRPSTDRLALWSACEINRMIPQAKEIPLRVLPSNVEVKEGNPVDATNCINIDQILII